MIKNIRMPGSAKLFDVFDAFFHEAKVFPEDTDETILFAAKNVANEWSDWTEIVDNNAVTLSSKFASNDGHITYIIAETTNQVNKVYIVEIAYGSAKTVASRLRFYGGSVPKQSQRMHAIKIPAGETIYYRMKCETASAEAEVHVRYYLE